MVESVISKENQLVIIISVVVTVIGTKIADVLYNNIESNYKNLGIIYKSIGYITFIALFLFIIILIVCGLVLFLNKIKKDKKIFLWLFES